MALAREGDSQAESDDDDDSAGNARAASKASDRAPTEQARAVYRRREVNCSRGCAPACAAGVTAAAAPPGGERTHPRAMRVALVRGVVLRDGIVRAEPADGPAAHAKPLTSADHRPG